MANAMLDARQEGDSYRRIEVITGQRRRRRWTAEEKARIVAESFEDGRQHFRGGSAQWRCPWAAHGLAAPVCGGSRRARRQASCRSGLAAESGRGTTGEPDRVAPAQTGLLEMASPPGKLGGVIEIEVSGARIRVEPGVELTTLSTVLSALRGGR